MVVLPFQPRNARPSHTLWYERPLAAIAYVVVGAILWMQSISLWGMLALYIIYWLALQRGPLQRATLVKYHYLVACVLFFVAALALLLWGAIAQVIVSLASPLGVAGIIAPALGLIPVAAQWIMIAVTAALMVTGLLAQMPDIPWVSRNVRAWL